MKHLLLRICLLSLACFLMGCSICLRQKNGDLLVLRGFIENDSLKGEGSTSCDFNIREVIRGQLTTNRVTLSFYERSRLDTKCLEDCYAVIHRTLVFDSLPYVYHVRGMDAAVGLIPFSEEIDRKQLARGIVPADHKQPITRDAAVKIAKDTASRMGWGASAKVEFVMRGDEGYGWYVEMGDDEWLSKRLLIGYDGQVIGILPGL